MKRFLLFASYERYDYSRGWEDFIGDFASIRGAMKVVDSHAYEWWHIVDTTKMKIVKSSD